MEANESYRPGNLIVGGGGRGLRRGPKDLGIGQWEIIKEEGDVVGMTYIRKGPSPAKQTDEEKFEKIDGEVGNKIGRGKKAANGR